MKKVLAMLICITLFVGTLTGCAKETSEDDANKPAATSEAGKDVAGEDEAGKTDESKELVDVNFLLCWNGGSSSVPDDQENNMVLKRIAEKTGVRLHIESISSNETEKLNTIFSSGTVPDLVSAAYWWQGAGEVLAMRKGISEGLIYDLTDLLPDYPNAARLLTDGVSSNYATFELNLPEYNGRKYFIPTETPSGKVEDVQNPLYGVFARKDILDALNIDPSSIKNEEDIYQLAIKIRDGGFTDATGGEIIPISTWHNGWKYTEMLKPMESNGYLSNYRLNDNGEVVHWAFLDVEREKIRYMRKLISEGLFDVESFTQSDTTANEKFAIGKVGIFGAMSQVNQLSATLYKTNPEMEYTLLGPLVNRAGQMCTTIAQNGANGSPVLFLSGSLEEEKARAILGMIDYINSEEGRLLMKYGIEGETYTMVDGIPTYTDEVQNAINDDSSAKKNYGLDLVGKLVGAQDYTSKYPTPEDKKTDVEKLEDTYKVRMPVYITDKIGVGPFERSYDKMAEYYDAISTLDLDAEIKLAYFAATDEEAMAIWDAALQKLKDAGVDGMCAAVAEGIKNYPNPDELSY